MKKLNLIIMLILTSTSTWSQKPSVNDRIAKIAEEEVQRYNGIYIDLHKNPELSLMEVNTSRKMAEELRAIGFEVTTGIGGNGVVGVFRNGKGKVIMHRTDMDALPVKENTGLPYSSTVVMKNGSGNEYPVMHACGHDLHMSVWLGTLRALVSMKNEWSGTILAVGQPAEEGFLGANSMIKDGLFKKFPVPDYALCYHVSAEMAAGTVGYLAGPIFAGVKTAEITVYGSGGHGAMPHTTIDPIVISARIILDIQTIVSRRINPVKPAVVTVGSIHGGTTYNVIPDEVKMLLTIRFFEDDVFKTIKESLIQITRGAAISAGLPENKMPLVVFDEADKPPVINNPDLVMSGARSMKNILGVKNVIQVSPATVAEDFGKYGRTPENIPIALFWLGGVNNELYSNHIEKGTFLPPLHNSSFTPDFAPAFRCGVTGMTRTMIDLFSNKNAAR
jgi:amidohydrolase